jgi:hypothetical protein
LPRSNYYNNYNNCNLYARLFIFIMIKILLTAYYYCKSLLPLHTRWIHMLLILLNWQRRQEVSVVFDIIDVIPEQPKKTFRDLAPGSGTIQNFPHSEIDLTGNKKLLFLMTVCLFRAALPAGRLITVYD